jgi:hypothetical protein
MMNDGPAAEQAKADAWEVPDFACVIHDPHDDSPFENRRVLYGLRRTDGQRVAVSTRANTLASAELAELNRSKGTVEGSRLLELCSSGEPFAVTPYEEHFISIWQEKYLK